MLELPDGLRDALGEPLGPVFTDTGSLLAAPDAGSPLVAVGDVVTYHLVEADHHPDVAVIDGRTKRERVDPTVDAVLPDPDLTVANPPAVLTRALLDALVTARSRPAPTVVGVEGEEDLAALPAILATPRGGAVVYGQPGEGMVLVPVADGTRSRARELLASMRGDADAALALLDPAT